VVITTAKKVREPGSRSFEPKAATELSRKTEY
jgi:hypothetical protein